MKRPKTIKVFNFEYQILIAKREHSDAMDAWGWCDRNRQTITLSKGMSPAQERDTLLHEIMHVLVALLQLSRGPSEEEICTRLSTGLMTVLSDNPKFAQWLLSPKS